MQTLNKIRGHERIMFKKNTQNNVRVLANLPKNQKDKMTLKEKEKLENTFIISPVCE